KEESKKKVGSYLETDIDSGQQIDLATVVDVASPDSYKPSINHHRQNAGTQEDWDIEDADQNTKQFYGLVPREKPKGLTVRDVKRQSEQRKERLKKEDDVE
ncbi:Pleckstriny domain-containing family A member 7, partial [Biomphalaria glabrata]